MSDILQRAIEEAALQMNDDELRSYQKELGECEILVKNLESDKAALTRELEAALTASQAREARLREALTEARVKVNSRAINLEDNDEFVLADEYHRVLKQIDAALDTERSS